MPWSLWTIKSPGLRSSSEVRSLATFDFLIGLYPGLPPNISFSVRIKMPGKKRPDERSPTVIETLPLYSKISVLSMTGATTPPSISMFLSLSAWLFDEEIRRISAWRCLNYPLAQAVLCLIGGLLPGILRTEKHLLWISVYRLQNSLCYLFHPRRIQASEGFPMSKERYQEAIRACCTHLARQQAKHFCNLSPEVFFQFL